MCQERRAKSASALFSRLPACGENTPGKPSRACVFHWAICVGWTPSSVTISVAVFCPLTASRVTLVFKLLPFALTSSSPSHQLLDPALFSSRPVQFLGTIGRVKTKILDANERVKECSRPEPYRARCDTLDQEDQTTVQQPDDMLLDYHYPGRL